MPQLYVLRRFSSWGFRLGVSVALLVSSAGLAASLLAGTALGRTEAPKLSWQPATAPAQAASGLGPGGPALPGPLRRRGPAYYFAASPAAAAPAGTPGPDQRAAAPAVFLSPASSFKATVQHSWHTFKLAFR